MSQIRARKSVLQGQMQAFASLKPAKRILALL
jgi:hypothetical protein